MQVELKVEGLSEAIKGLAALPKQVRFAASVGANRTMNDAQKAIQDSLASRFTLRRESFIRGTIYRKPGVDWATADNLQAGVRVNDQRNLLAKFEEGGNKTPRDGKALGVPILGGARATKGALVPDKYKLKTLFFNQRGRVAQALTLGGTKKRGARKALLKASAAQNIAVIRDKVFEIVGTKRSPKLKLLWVFKSSVRIAPKLGFIATGKAVIDKDAVSNIEGAISLELSRGLNVTAR
jgi:hypothetical protein